MGLQQLAGLGGSDTDLPDGVIDAATRAGLLPEYDRRGLRHGDRADRPRTRAREHTDSGQTRGGSRVRHSRSVPAPVGQFLRRRHLLGP